MQGILTSKLYKLLIQPIRPAESVALSAHSALHAGTFSAPNKKEGVQPLQVWHQRLGHVHHNMIKSMIRNDTVDGLTVLNSADDNQLCSGCAYGKNHKATFPWNDDRQKKTNAGDLIHLDICGPMSVNTVSGAKYYSLFKDDATGYRVIYCMAKKSETFLCFKCFVTLLEIETKLKVRTLRSDRGSEYTSKAFQDFLLQKGIKQELTAAYTPEQNGVAERDNRTIMESVRSMIYAANVHLRFWGEAAHTAVYCLNRTATRMLHGRSPFEAWHGVRPSVSHMRIFGADAYMFVPDELRTKLAPKSNRGIFMGYSQNSKAYRIWLNDKQKIAESRNVLFDEASVTRNAHTETPPQKPDHTFPLLTLTSVGHGPHTGAVGVGSTIGAVGDRQAHEAVAADPTGALGAVQVPQAAPVIPIFAPAGVVPDNIARGLAPNLQQPPAPAEHDLQPTTPPESTLNDHTLITAAASTDVTQTNSDPADNSDATLATWEDITLGDARFTIPAPASTVVITEIPDAPDNATNDSVQAREAKPSMDPRPRERRPPNRYGEWIHHEGRHLYAGMATTPTRPYIPAEPKTYLQATKSSEKAHWHTAMQQEFNSLISNNTWILQDLPPGRSAIQNKWIYKLKLAPDGSVARFKARLVAKGFSQREGVDYSETFSPVVKFDSIRAILSIAAADNLLIKQFNVETAFLYGDISEDIYMVQPAGFTDPNNPEQVCKVIKSLYGLKQSACNWNKKFRQTLQTLGLRPTLADPCVFVSSSGPTLILAIFVDDGIICSQHTDQIDKVLHQMQDAFKITTATPEIYVGLHINRDLTTKTLQLDQNRYIHKKLEEYGYHDCAPLSIPADPHAQMDFLTSADEPNDQHFPYGEIVGSLHFASQGTRPDITYATCHASKFTKQPKKSHIAGVKRIMKYLKGSPSMHITYAAGSQRNILTAFCDADYAADIDDRKSRSGFVLMLNGGPIAWGSRKQGCTARSTTEAEYMAAHLATNEVIWMRQLLAELGYPQRAPTLLRSDNQAAIRLVHNPEFHKRTKHVDVKYHILREHLLNNVISIAYIPTNDQLADLFTKPLPRDKFLRMIHLIGLTAIPCGSG
jgi:hypothetical protein